MAEAELCSTGDFFPCRAVARIYDGDVLLAETPEAFSTTAPELLGQCLIPRAALLVEAARIAPHVLEERDGPAGPSLLLDHAALRIEMTDTRPGWPDGTESRSRFPRWGDAEDLLGLMDVARVGDGLYEAPAYAKRGRSVVEGSQILATQIVAASRAVPDKRAVSAYAIFSRPATPAAPMLHRLGFPRLGRSFATVAVESEQAGRSMSSGLVLLDKGAPDVIRRWASMPDVPGPDDCPDHDFGMSGRQTRFVDGDMDDDPDRVGPAVIHGWVRYREPPDGLCLRQALIAQYTGHMTIAAAMLPHPGVGEALAHHSLSTGILAITIAFHDEPDLSDWILYSNPAIYAGNGLAQGEGRVFARDGRMLASYSVQAMIRAFEEDPARHGSAALRM